MAYAVEFEPMNETQYLAIIGDQRFLVSEDDLRLWKEKIVNILPRPSDMRYFIADVVSSGFNMSVQDLFRKSNERRYSLPRMIYFDFCAKHTRFSYADIAQYPKDRGWSKKAWDHSSVVYARKKIEDTIYPEEKKILKCLDHIITKRVKPESLFGSFDKITFNSDWITL